MKNKDKKRRPLRRLLLCLFIGAALCAVCVSVINIHITESVKDRIMTAAEAADFGTDCILVLGAGVREDGSPSHMLEDRLLQGIELYELGAAPKLLLSGDHGQEEYDEVNCMKRFSQAANVPPEDIFMDHAGFSTYESMYRARDIFLAKRVIIVTQRYHMYRALYIAQSLGLEAYGVASDPRGYAGQLYRDLREALARVKDFFYVKAAPAPTYLGDTIPIFGDGTLTGG